MQPKIEGYAAKFYTPADKAGTQYYLGSGVYERIAPTAFTRALRERADVLGVFNHDHARLLGRVSAHTLRLSTDSVGLRYEIDISKNDPDHVGVVSKLARGDLRGSSFMFGTRKETFAQEGKFYIRILEDVSLYDVGPVSTPAYTSTTAALSRSQQERLALARSVKQRQTAILCDLLTPPPGVLCARSRVESADGKREVRDVLAAAWKSHAELIAKCRIVERSPSARRDQVVRARMKRIELEQSREALRGAIQRHNAECTAAGQSERAISLEAR